MYDKYQQNTRLHIYKKNQSRVIIKFSKRNIQLHIWEFKNDDEYTEVSDNILN
jgi:ribosomal protein L18